MEKKEGGQQTSRWQSLTHEQRLAAGIFVVCGIVALTLGVLQVRRAFIRPFTASLDEFVAYQRSLAPSDDQVAEEQKHTDTDGDGISDWAELNVYHTSPYLADSDSDKIPDNIEIAKGTDPNCAEGTVCSSAFVISASSTVTAEDMGVSNPDPNLVNSSGVPARSPEAIRAFLKMRGMSESDLRQYSDEALLKAYDQAANGMGSATSSLTE